MSAVAALNRDAVLSCMACFDRSDPDILFLDLGTVRQEVADLALMIEMEFEDCMPEFVSVVDRATLITLASNAYCDKCGREVTS